MTRRGSGGGASNQKIQAFLKHFTLALKCHETGQLLAAEAEYRKALTYNPKDATALTNLGVVLYATGRAADAIPLLRRAIALDATSAIGFNNLGVALNALHRYPEAVAAYTKGAELNPRNATTLSNLGDALTNAGRYSDSVVYLNRALALRPDYPEAHSNLGMAYWGLGRLDEAEASLRLAIRLNPGLAMARKNLGIVLLLRGQYAEGWQEYDYRWTSDGIPLRFLYPLWTGKQIDGEVLIWAEQGPGDEILQASMMADLVAAGIRLVWECDPRLVPLFQRSYPTVRVVPRRNPPVDMGPEIKAHLPAASVGHLVRGAAARFPSARRGHLLADAAKIVAFRARANLAPGEKLVGISWVSHNVVFGEKKTTRLADWADILRTPGFKFVDLQYQRQPGDTAAERRAAASDQGIDLLHFDDLDPRDDLDGLAALCAACDLVITVSNTTAHVAGAVGTPVWILVAAGGGKLWYWGTDDVEVPAWYPTARIIRQRAGDPWSKSLATAAQRLAALLPG